MRGRVAAVSTASERVRGRPGGVVAPPGSPPATGGEGSLLPYYGYRAAEAVVGILPRRVAYGLAVGAADCLRVLRPRAVDGLRANLRHVLPDAEPRALRRVVRRNLRHLSRSWIDVMAMRADRERITRGLHVAGMERYIEACATGRGVAVISLHLGSWEKGLAGADALGYPMALLAEYLRPHQLFERIAGARGALGVRVIPIDVAGIRGADTATARRIGVAAIREVVRVLRGGGAIALAMDRDLIGNGRPYRFFDAEAPIPAGVVELAMRMGAVILPVALPRTRAGIAAEVHPEIAYDPDAPRDQEVNRVVMQILRIFEDVIRRHPEQWNVLDSIWEPAGP